MYEIGNYIIKSVNGVCKVEDILQLDILGADRNRLYYLLLPIDDEKGKIYIPTDKVDSSVRKVMKENEAWELIEKIPQMEETWIDNDKLREKKYKEAIRSNNQEELTAIIKQTYLRKKERLEQGKKIMAVDEHYFKIAENNLYSELGFVLKKDKEEICKLITDCCEE